MIGPVTAARFSDLLVKELPPNPAWVEPKILPKGGTLLLGGEAKVGKSFVMLEIARALTTGTKLFGCANFYTMPAKVLLVEAEIGEYGLQERGRQVMAKENPDVYGDRYYFISKDWRLQLDTPEGRKHFKALIGDVRPNVLILDPISFMQSVDENKATEIGQMYAVLESFKKLHPDDRMSIVMSHHFKKPPDNPDYRADYDFLSQYNFRGSGKWKDAPDSLLTMFRYEEIEAPWESWKLHCRWLLRHGSAPPEMDLHVNETGDLHVKWAVTRSKMRKLELGPPKKKKKPAAVEAEQEELLFEPA